MDAPHLLPWCLLLLLLTLAGSSTASNGGVSAARAPATAPKAVGFGYRLVSLVERPNGGGLVGCLQVKQRTSTYGPDIPRLRLFVK
jgi:alpha-D-xyloside xylohydrolase